MNEDLINVSIYNFIEYNYFVMRAIYILFFLFILLLNGCTTVQVAEGVAKVSVKVVEGVTSTASKSIEIVSGENKEKNKEKSNDLLKEKAVIKNEKEKEVAVVIKQKNINKTDLIGLSLNQLQNDFGKPDFIREDGNTKIVRFDGSSCSLFLYFDSLINKPRAEYFEIRNKFGELIERKEKIEKCFAEVVKT